MRLQTTGTISTMVFKLVVSDLFRIQRFPIPDRINKGYGRLLDKG